MLTSNMLTSSMLTSSSVDHEIFGPSGESPANSLISGLTLIKSVCTVAGA